MRMKMIISNKSPVPIYEQIKNNIIEQIMSNELGADEVLPSIRVLAKDIKISIMTVKKAYDELETEGYIKVIQGKGTFVAPWGNALKKENINKTIENNLAKAIELAKNNNIKKEELIDLINLLYEGE